jgi:hypothetical protein
MNFRENRKTKISVSNLLRAADIKLVKLIMC